MHDFISEEANIETLLLIGQIRAHVRAITCR